MEYNAINLKHQNDVVSAARPYLNTIGIQDMSYIFDVNGAAILASA